MTAHVVTDSHVLWYPFLALALPILIIVVLTIYDRTSAVARRFNSRQPLARTSR